VAEALRHPRTFNMKLTVRAPIVLHFGSKWSALVARASIALFRATLELRADERLYALDLYRGGLNAIGYRVIVRKIGSRWVITELQVA
jgi:hypothetical protein